MDEIMDAMMGIDKNGEILNLWYEITFLRMVMNKILELNPKLYEKISEQDYVKARQQSQDIVKNRFPNCNVNFPNEIK